MGASDRTQPALLVMETRCRWQVLLLYPWHSHPPCPALTHRLAWNDRGQMGKEVYAEGVMGQVHPSMSNDPPAPCVPSHPSPPSLGPQTLLHHHQQTTNRVVCPLPHRIVAKAHLAKVGLPHDVDRIWTASRAGRWIRDGTGSPSVIAQKLAPCPAILAVHLGGAMPLAGMQCSVRDPANLHGSIPAAALARPNPVHLAEGRRGAICTGATTQAQRHHHRIRMLLRRSPALEATSLETSRRQALPSTNLLLGETRCVRLVASR